MGIINLQEFIAWQEKNERASLKMIKIIEDECQNNIIQAVGMAWHLVIKMMVGLNDVPEGREIAEDFADKMTSLLYEELRKVPKEELH